MIDLAPHHLETVQRILREHVPDCEVRAFGSRAKWEGQDYSDLDLAVLSENDSNGRAIERLREAFEESDLPIRVDVLDWHALADDFRQAIESDCVVVQQGFDPAIWRESTVGEFATFRYGKALAASRRVTSGSIPVYGSNGVTGYHDSSLTDGPTIIIGRKGTAGAVHYSSVPCWPIDTTFFVTGCDTELVRFKYYALSALGLETMNADSAVPGLNRDAAHARELRVPDEHEQRDIAGVLGALDDKIELNRRMSETLEEMARTLFQSWFVDFDPVRAKAEDRPSGLPLDIDALFPSVFEESELGEIPKGWQVRSLDDIADFTNGLALQRFPPDGADHLPVIKIAEMRRGYSDRTARASANIDPRYIVTDGDILFSWSGTLEVVLWSHGPGALNQHLFKVTSDKFPKWFYWGWTLEHLDDFRRIAAGKATTMGHIQRQHLTDARVVVPPVELVRAAGGPLATLIERQAGHALHSRRLVAQRDALLPRLLSGKLRVGGVKRDP
jgi:type I restriction enzyme S subunit